MYTIDADGMVNIVGRKNKMIPLWLTITCSIISLIVIFYILITSDIDWKDTIQIFTADVIAVITIISVAIIFISIGQRLS